MNNTMEREQPCHSTNHVMYYLNENVKDYLLILILLHGLNLDSFCQSLSQLLFVRVNVGSVV